MSDKNLKSTVQHTGKHILIVEDNKVNQVVASRLLDKLGYTSGIAENGQVALDKLENEAFDLVLMDCQMPVMDGYLATQAIRRHDNEKLRSIKIIGLTANAMANDREKCLDAGMDDYVSKPIDVSKLSETIKNWI